jgi:hypothetical protein
LLKSIQEPEHISLMNSLRIFVYGMKTISEIFLLVDSHKWRR